MLYVYICPYLGGVYIFIHNGTFYVCPFLVFSQNLYDVAMVHMIPPPQRLTKEGGWEQR